MSNKIKLDGLKMTEIGPLPADWKVVRVGDAFEITRKPRGLDYARYSEIPFVPMELVPSNRVRFTSFETRRSDQISSGTYFNEGDLLLSKITPCFENGKQGIIDGIGADFGIASTEIIPIHAKPDVGDIEFLANFLLGSDVRSELAGRMEGATGRQRLSKSTLENLLIPLPSLSEQKRISGTLSNVWRAKEKSLAAINAARELRKSLMKHLFTYGPISVAQSDHVQLKNTEIGGMPEEWGVMLLGECLETTQYGLSIRGEKSGRYPIIRMNNLSEGRVVMDDAQYVDLNESQLSKHKLNNDDILFNRTNSHELVGKTSIFDIPGDFVFASYIVRLVTDKTKLLPEFLNYYANWEATQTRMKFLASRGVSQSNISASKLKTLKVCVPPMEDQRRTAGILRRLDDVLRVARDEVLTQGRLCSSLLDSLMKGKIRVNNLEVPP